MGVSALVDGESETSESLSGPLEGERLLGVDPVEELELEVAREGAVGEAAVDLVD